MGCGGTEEGKDAFQACHQVPGWEEACFLLGPALQTSWGPFGSTILGTRACVCQQDSAVPLGSGLTQGHAGQGLLPLNFPPVLLKLTLTLTQDRQGVGLWDAAGPMVRHLS